MYRAAFRVPAAGRAAALGRQQGQQALFEFNNDGRRQAERTCGIWRSTGETYHLDAPNWISAEGEWMETDCCDEQSDPAERHERQIAGSLLEQLLREGQDAQAASWLREWTAADISRCMSLTARPSERGRTRIRTEICSKEFFLP